MTVAQAWALLGIAPTGEEREVKRAYARVLKTIDVDSDPESFRQLREAYETALAWGTRVPEWETAGWDDDEALWPQEDPAAGAGGEAGDLPLGFDLPGSGWYGSWRPSSPAGMSGRLGELALELDALLFGDEAPDPERVASLGEEFCAESIVARVDDAAAAEAWLLEAVAASPPRSDPLIEPALRRFGWTSIERDWQHERDAASVLARRQDSRFAARLRDRRHPQHRAFVELSGPPRSRLGLFELGIAADVRDLLRIVDQEHPTVVADFDPDSLAWWRRYFLGPHLPDQFWLILIVLSPALILATSLTLDGRLQAPGFWLLVLLIFAATALAVIAWSRVAGALRIRAEELRWSGDDRREAKALPYAVGALVLPPLASLVQLGTATAVLYALAAVAVAGGLMIHAPPPPFEIEAESNRRRTVAGIAALGAIAVLIALPAATVLHLLAPMAVLIFAAARAEACAGAAIGSRGRGAELSALAAAALLCAVPLAAFAVSAPHLPPVPVLVLVPVAFVVQHLATSTSPVAIPRLEWALRVAAIVFHFASGETVYGGARLRAFVTAVALYLLVYALARIAFAAREALRLRRPSPGGPR